MFFIVYAFKGQVHVLVFAAGRVKIVIFCPLLPNAQSRLSIHSSYIQNSRGILMPFLIHLFTRFLIIVIFGI